VECDWGEGRFNKITFLGGASGCSLNSLKRRIGLHNENVNKYE
jgi:hypothetical protein